MVEPILNCVSIRDPGIVDVELALAIFFHVSRPCMHLRWQQDCLSQGHCERFLCYQ